VFGRVGVRLASAAAAMARGVKAMSPRPLVQHVEQARVYFSGMRHGVKGMYRGFGYSTALQMPSNMIYLSSYLVITEALQAQLERCCTNSAAARCRLEGLAALIPVTAAMCSETLVSLIEVPHDVITQKLQVQHAARSQGFQRSWRTPSRVEVTLRWYKGAPPHFGPVVRHLVGYLRRRQVCTPWPLFPHECARVGWHACCYLLPGAVGTHRHHDSCPCWHDCWIIGSSDGEPNRCG